ncbi:MAG: hypothetical protein ABR583_10805 [Gaiellaceae bacterium]
MRPASPSSSCWPPWYRPRFGFEPARSLGIEPPSDRVRDEV